ncbi:MAG: ABC transporter permease [Acidobacteria bacterium]|nr:ABC transporter permease [Acidobacteriota bacterium]
MFTLKMALREFRSSWRNFIFPVIAIAIGVGAVTGVQGLSRGLQRALLREARKLIAADLRLRSSAPPASEETAALAALSRNGAEISRVIETVSMVGTGQQEDLQAASRARDRVVPGDLEYDWKSVLKDEEDRAGPSADQRRTDAPAAAQPRPPVLVSLKAVEAGYPYFGSIELQPAGALQEILKDSAVVSPDLLLRLDRKVGDLLRIGDIELPIGAVLVQEPDRLASGVEFGPRVLLSRQSLERTGLIQFGSRASYIYLVRLPERGLSVDAARNLVRSYTERFRMSDYRDPNPRLSRGLERMTSFLSLTGLLALLVGGLGVALAMHAYLQQKLDNIAILKSLGGRSGQILRIYLAQTWIIALLGSLLGLAAGLAMQSFLPLLLHGLLELNTRVEWSGAVFLQGLAVGLLATSALVLPALLAIREVKAAEVFRRDVEGGALRWSGRARQWTRIGPVFAVNLAVIGAVASWVADSWRRGFGFVAVLVVLLSLFAIVGRLMFHVPGALSRWRSLSLRHGLANLRRPGSQAVLTFAALAMGVTLTLTIYLLQTSLLRELVRSAPPDFPNLILIGISDDQHRGIWTYLRSAPGVVDPGEPVAAAPGRLISVDGEPASDRAGGEGGRRFSRIDFSLTWAREMPPDTTLVRGEWWTGQPHTPEVSVGQFAAESLRLEPGSRLVFLSAGKTIEGIVANVRETDSLRPGANNQFIFSPGALDGLPLTYVANVRVDPAALPLLQKGLFERFPGVTSINILEMVTVIQQLVDRISLIIQFVAAFAIAAAVAVLASSVASSRQRRLREAVLLKTLGATRRKVAAIHLVEFATTGLLAGVAGTLCASGLTSFLLDRLFDTRYQFHWGPSTAAVGATVLLVAATGWLAGRSALQHKPLEVLREL